MMSFNLRTETFHSNPIPEPPPKFKIFMWEYGPFNIKGKVGISFKDFSSCHHRIWVLEDMKNNKWSQLLLETPITIIHDVPNRFLSPLSFDGLRKGGDIVFTCPQGSSLVLYYYNRETQQFEKNLMEGVFGLLENRSRRVYVCVSK